MYQRDGTRLRGVNQNDLAFLAEVRNCPEVAKQLFSPDLIGDATQQEWIRSQSASDSRRLWILESVAAEAGARIGYCQLMNIDRFNASAECGLNLHPHYWGRGLGEASWRCLMTYSFVELNLRRLWLSVFGFNERAIRLYQKLRFVKEGVFRSAAYKSGSYHDVVVMGALQAEWCKSEGAEAP